MWWGSALAIYFLFWFFSLFLVLPFYARTSVEAGEALIPGQAESAPHSFSGVRVALRTTLVATILFALFYLNYIFGWVTADAFDYWS